MNKKSKSKSHESIKYYDIQRLCTNCPLIHDNNKFSPDDIYLKNIESSMRISKPINRLPEVPIPPKPVKIPFKVKWNLFIIGFLSKQFHKPFKYLVLNFYTSKIPEYVSVFNLYSQAIKKDFLKDCYKEFEIDKIKKEIKDAPNGDGMHIEYENNDFIAYSKLEKQDKLLKNLGDEV